MQNARRFGLFFQRDGEQQPFDRDIGVAGLLGDLAGIVENAGQRRRHIDLSGARAAHFRQLDQRRLGLRQRFARAPTGAVDKAGGETLLVIQQHFQQMFGRKLGVTLAHGE